MQTTYQDANKWLKVLPAVYTPAYDKRPYGNNHPSAYAHRGAGVYGKWSEWWNASGMCVMPLAPYLVIDLDNSHAIMMALQALPELLNTLYVLSPKGVHFYVKLDAPEAYWRSLPRSIVRDGKEQASIRGGYWNTYAIGAGSKREDGGYYEGRPDLTKPIELPTRSMTVLLEMLGFVFPEPPNAKSLLPSSASPLAVRYAESAFLGGLLDIETALEGTRNRTLFRVAWKLYSMANAGYLQLASLEPHLVQAALKSGLPLPEIQRTIASARARAKKTWSL